MPTVSIPNGLPTLLPQEIQNTETSPEIPFQSQTGFLHFFHAIERNIPPGDRTEYSPRYKRVSIPNGLPTLLPRLTCKAIQRMTKSFNPKRASYTSSTRQFGFQTQEIVAFQSQTGFLHFFHIVYSFPSMSIFTVSIPNGLPTLLPPPLVALFPSIWICFNPKRASYTSSTTGVSVI